MEERLALHGPMYSGKTTLGHALEAHHGFTFVDYTGHLKVLAASALNGASGYQNLHSVAQIAANKANYRTFLQELGRLIDYDSGDPFIADQLTGVHDDRIVFDNVRTPQQWAILRERGFTLVRLGITHQTQQRRAAALGVTPDQLAAARAHAVEQPLPEQPGEIVLWADCPTDALVAQVLAALDSPRATGAPQP